MKIRRCFVSNSSSSSFIVGIKEGQPKHILDELDFLLTRVYSNDFDMVETLSTKKELKKYLKENWWLDEDKLKGILFNVNHFPVLIMTLNNHDSLLQEMIFSNNRFKIYHRLGE